MVIDISAFIVAGVMILITIPFLPGICIIGLIIYSSLFYITLFCWIMCQGYGPIESIKHIRYIIGDDDNDIDIIPYIRLLKRRNVNDNRPREE